MKVLTDDWLVKFARKRKLIVGFVRITGGNEDGKES
jgi:hypothetical protein